MANYHPNLEYCVNDNVASRSLKLKFLTGVSSPAFTGKKLQARGGGGGGSNGFIGVVLVDSRSNQEVNVGPVASAKVKIVLLPGDGGATPGNSAVWTPLEFKNSIILKLKNKKNILLGDLSLVLENGRGIIGEIRVKHDGNYQRKGRFRLGAMAVEFSDEVQEAISDPFEIKDSRNELNNKNRPLSPTDKVCQLKLISPKGPIRKRLEAENIKTVKDFLDMLYSNTQFLQKIYGSNGKKWDITVHHAKTCIDNVSNVGRLVGSTYEQSFFDCVMFDDDCYAPHLYEEGSAFDNTMTTDFSIEDLEEPLMLFQHENHGLKPCQADQEDGTHNVMTVVGADDGVMGFMAKKRWIKFRQVWLLMRYLKKKVVGAGGDVTLV